MLTTLSGPEWNDVSEDVKELIRRMLCKPEIRITATEVLKHKWLQSTADNSKLKVKVENLARWTSYSKLKRICLTYVATQLSDEDANQLKQLFTAVDKDSDGFISFDELRAFVASSLKDKHQHEQLKKSFDAIDTDQNGLIDYNGTWGDAR